MWFDLISLTQRLRNNSSVSKYLSKQNKNLENTNSISGNTDENGDPLPGASITIKGTKTTTVSEFDGYYQINASQSETLVIAYIGYSDNSCR
jgi:hypothetical protein